MKAKISLAYVLPLFVGSTPARRIPDFEYVNKEMAKSGVTLSLLWHEYVVQCRQLRYGKSGRNFAKRNVAPLVKVYESETSDFQELKMHKEFKFKEYECGCYEEILNDESY